MTGSPSTTQLLIDWSNGNRAALDELTAHVYRELHALARTYLNRERPNQTLQPTALISEVYLRLIEPSQSIQWESRSHFLGIAARLMRRVLVDYARAHRASKRGGGQAVAVSLEETMAFSHNRAPDILELDEALTRLAEIDERKVKVIELHYLGGMTREETARALGLTVPTVKRDLRLAEAWLRSHLKGEQLGDRFGNRALDSRRNPV